MESQRKQDTKELEFYFDLVENRPHLKISGEEFDILDWEMETIQFSSRTNLNKIRVVFR